MDFKKEVHFFCSIKDTSDRRGEEEDMLARNLKPQPKYGVLRAVVETLIFGAWIYSMFLMLYVIGG